uniref:Uncharacterized protein n=1 Tax=Anopheles arabiensis TaxID=7173 RepID=A0A182HP35_ANOAR
MAQRRAIPVKRVGIQAIQMDVWGVESAHHHHQFLLLLFIAPGDVAAAATAENMRMHASSGEDVKIDCQIGTPINRLPIMAKSVLDLYELYNLVIARGGLVDVINKKLWQEIIKGLHLPSSITSAAFTLRTQ